MQLLSGQSHETIGRTDGIKEVTGMYADIRFDLDDPVNSLDEAPEDILLSHGQARGTSFGVVGTGPEMSISQMTDFHVS